MWCKKEEKIVPNSTIMELQRHQIERRINHGSIYITLETEQYFCAIFLLGTVEPRQKFFHYFGLDNSGYMDVKSSG